MDLAVIGLGALGAATLRAAARAGASCIGIDARSPGHAEGSSHGGSRIIRRALFEHSDYVTIVSRAYELWAELEQESDRHVFDSGTGLLLGGPAGGALIAGTRAAARAHHLPIEELRTEDVARRFPTFLPPEDFELLWDPDGGILRPEQAVLAQVEGARARGAGVSAGQGVRSLRREGEGFLIETARDSVRAERVVLCPGPWAKAGLLPGPPPPWRLLRKVLLWRAPFDGRWALGTAPVFAFESGDSLLYGFPALDERGVKIADHGGGREVAAPEQDLPIGEEDERIDALAARFLTGLAERPSERATCLYTSTPDGHAVLGLSPAEPGLAFAAGFCGHGFKHSIALGEALADLVLDGRSQLPLRLFDPGRFGSQPAEG